MSRRSDIDCIHDMLEAARRADGYCEGLQYDDFMRDIKTQDAVVRNLEILGEAAKGVSMGLRKRYDSLPWSSVAGMRDRLIHGYFGVNLDIVWDVVKNDLPPMVEVLKEAAADS